MPVSNRNQFALLRYRPDEDSFLGVVHKPIIHNMGLEVVLNRRYAELRPNGYTLVDDGWRYIGLEQGEYHHWYKNTADNCERCRLLFLRWYMTRGRHFVSCRDDIPLERYIG